MQMAESWIIKCGSRLIYKLLPGKEILYVIPITSVLGKLLTVRAGDTGTIPYRYSGTNRSKRSVARANSEWKWQPNVFRELLGHGVVACYLN